MGVREGPQQQREWRGVGSSAISREEPRFDLLKLSARPTFLPLGMIQAVFRPVEVSS